MDGFPHAAEIAVRFAETDAQGVAHNANYPVWFEVARVEYLRAFAGGYNAVRERGVEILVTETHVRHFAPAFFDDRLAVGARCRDVRGARFRFEYEVRRGSDVLADGWTAHACVDAETLRPTRVPGWLGESIARAEEG